MSEPARARTSTSSDAARRLREATAGSVVAGLQPFAWDQDAAIAYEVAVDTIGLVIAAYSGMIADEERRAAPDRSLLQQWDEAITRATREERALSVDDRAAVERASAAYAAEHRRLCQPADA